MTIHYVVRRITRQRRCYGFTSFTPGSLLILSPTFTSFTPGSLLILSPISSRHEFRVPRFESRPLNPMKTSSFTLSASTLRPSPLASGSRSRQADGKHPHGFSAGVVRGYAVETSPRFVDPVSRDLPGVQSGCVHELAGRVEAQRPGHRL